VNVFCFTVNNVAHILEVYITICRPIYHSLAKKHYTTLCLSMLCGC